MKNALTVDLEDWYHPELVKRHVGDQVESQILSSAAEILALFDRYRVKATFFILGDVANKHPDLVKKIHAQGHEIASHGMSHKPLWDLSYQEFDRELKDFSQLMAQILGSGVKIRGFRAPTFSIDNRTKYALRCLAENGYAYDSSIFPAQNYLYGVGNAPCSIYRPDENDVAKEDGASSLVEFPMTVFDWAGLRLPVSGGFYLRVFPYVLLRSLLRRINKRRPFVIYFHPWETHLGTPRTKEIGVKNSFITYYGMKRALKKIERLLNDFEFEPMADVLAKATVAGAA